MKRTILYVAAVIALASCAPKATEGGEVVTSADVTVINEVLPIAVLNYDSLLANYEFAKVSNEELLTKQENARVEISEKVRQLQNEMVDFQRKIENNAFMSRERAEQEQRRLMKKESDIQELDQRLTQELMVQQQQLTGQLRDSIESVIKEINKDGRYHLILTTNALNDNVLYCAPQYDITEEVLVILNKRYNKK